MGEFGRAITLPCPVEGAPEPEVTWARNGIPLSETPNLRFNAMSNRSLHINFLRLEDGGMFQCSAANEAGEVVGYTWLKVKSELKRDEMCSLVSPVFILFHSFLS